MGSVVKEIEVEDDELASPEPEPPKEELIGFYLSRNIKTSEIEEEEEEEESSKELFEIKNYMGMGPIKEEEYDDDDLFSFEVGVGPIPIPKNREKMNDGDGRVVYVAVSKTSYDESMDALVWTLNHINLNSDQQHSTTTVVVYLIHVFNELRYLPTPLGKLPISQANPEQKQSFMIQERIKRTDFLQKFLHLCSTSKVRVETILIESDMEAKAILDLIPILYIKTLVLGTSKSTLRKMRSKRGSAAVDQILQNAPDFCEVKIICQGKQVIVEEQLMIDSPSPSPSPAPSPSPRASLSSPKVQDHIHDTFTCCFKPKAES